MQGAAVSLQRHSQLGMKTASPQRISTSELPVGQIGDSGVRHLVAGSRAPRRSNVAELARVPHRSNSGEFGYKNPLLDRQTQLRARRQCSMRLLLQLAVL